MLTICKSGITIATPYKLDGVTVGKIVKDAQRKVGLGDKGGRILNVAGRVIGTWQS